jgi:hypothetical protein
MIRSFRADTGREVRATRMSHFIRYFTAAGDLLYLAGGNWVTALRLPPR